MKSFGLVVLLAAAVPAFADQAATPPPADQMKAIAVAGASFSVWPYLSSDFVGASDPVNLVFPNTDPRAVRQALIGLDGARPTSPLSLLPGYGCRWTDAMGYEQAGFSDVEAWTGGVVQLACVEPGRPLGGPFRYHVRLFRAGPHTFGGAHYEWNIQGTAEHEVLSWDAARDFVTLDMHRYSFAAQTPVAITAIPNMITPGSFRAVRWPIYSALASHAKPLLDGLGLVPVASGQDVPIPTSGAAVAIAGDLPFDPVKSDATTTLEVQYSVITNKPFCNGPADYVKLEGPLQFSLRVQTNPSGLLLRTYHVGGMLRVTPVNPLTGQPVGEARDAAIAEGHRGQLTDEYGEVREHVAQVLLGDPQQSLEWTLAAGQRDAYDRTVSCGVQ
jgi:hypothetical protein